MANTSTKRERVVIKHELSLVKNHSLALRARIAVWHSSDSGHFADGDDNDS